MVKGTEFGDLLRQKIRDTRVSQYRLSKATGVSQGAISVWLRRGGDLSLRSFTKLAIYMGMELRDEVVE